MVYFALFCHLHNNSIYLRMLLTGKHIWDVLNFSSALTLMLDEGYVIFYMKWYGRETMFGFYSMLTST